MVSSLATKCPFSTTELVAAMNYHETVEQDQPEREYSESELSEAQSTGTLTYDQAIYLHANHINWQCHVRRG